MSDIEEFVNALVSNIVNPLIRLLFVVGFAYFLWGLFEFILNSSNDTKKEEGKKHMIWGVIGMFIMVSVAGIIALIRGTFGIPLP